MMVGKGVPGLSWGGLSADFEVTPTAQSYMGFSLLSASYFTATAFTLNSSGILLK